MSDNASLLQLGELAHAALREWGIEAAEVKLAAVNDNTLFSVLAPDGARYALRIHAHNNDKVDELRSELQWIRALASYGVPAPEVMTASDGELLKLVSSADIPDGLQCDLLVWVEGAALGAAGCINTTDAAEQREWYGRIGHLMGRIHNHDSDWPVPPNFKRPVWDADAIAGDMSAWARYGCSPALAPWQSDLLIAAGEIVRHKLETFGDQPDRYGLIHACLVPENLLVTGSDFALIGFEFSGYGWHLYDVATTLFPCSGGAFLDDIRKALLDGYGAERDLPEEHLDMLPTFLIARGLTTLGWLNSRAATYTNRQIVPHVTNALCELAEDYCG